MHLKPSELARGMPFVSLAGLFYILKMTMVLYIISPIFGIVITGLNRENRTKIYNDMTSARGVSSLFLCSCCWREFLDDSISHITCDACYLTWLLAILLLDSGRALLLKKSTSVGNSTLQKLSLVAGGSAIWWRIVVHNVQSLGEFSVSPPLLYLKRHLFLLNCSRSAAGVRRPLRAATGSRSRAFLSTPVTSLGCRLPSTRFWTRVAAKKTTSVENSTLQKLSLATGGLLVNDGASSCDMCSPWERPWQKCSIGVCSYLSM